MTSRERVLATLALTQPDKVPVDYIGNGGIDSRLKAHFGIEQDDYEGLLCALGVDFRAVVPMYKGPRLHPDAKDRTVDAEWGIRTRWVEHPSGGYWDFCDFPLRHADEETVAAWPMPSPDDYDYAAVAEYCKQFQDKALYVGNAGLGDFINSTGMIRGTDQVLMDLAVEDPAGLLYMDRRATIQLEVTRRIIEAGDGRVAFMWIGEDLGSQRAPIISVEMFRRMIRPRLQQYIDLAKTYDLPVMIHCCGASSWAFEDFIEMGIDAVDTLQPEATDMAPGSLKERFGGRLAFHGCISTAGPVAYGNVEDVVANVRETLEIMMPAGGYCLAPTHCVQDNSPTENVLAMYESAREYGAYRG